MRKIRKEKIESYRWLCDSPYFSKFCPYRNALERNSKCIINCRIQWATRLCNSLRENKVRKQGKMQKEEMKSYRLLCNCANISNFFRHKNPLEKERKYIIRCRIQCSIKIRSCHRGSGVRNVRKIRKEKIESYRWLCDSPYFSKFCPYQNALEKNSKRIIKCRIQWATRLCNSLRENKVRKQGKMQKG